MLSCKIPAITDGTTANVTFEWSGGDSVELYKSFSGANTVYSASWYTGIKLVDGRPTISGVGFSQDGDYQCLFFLPGAKDQSDSTTASFTHARTHARTQNSTVL